MLSKRPLSGELGDWEEPAIRWAVREAIRKRLFPFDDEDELTNTCVLHWLEVRGVHDQARGANPKTFLNVVTANYLIDLRRRRSLREKRTVRLDTPIANTDLTLGDVLRDFVPGVEEFAIEDDLRARTRGAIAILDGREKEIALGLMQGNSVTELHEALGISRQSCYRSMARIKKVFEERHLHEFLPPTRTLRNPRA